MKYKFGDFVKANDSDEKGIVFFVDNGDDGFPYGVGFEQGRNDYYREEELQLWEEKSVHTEESDPVEHPEHYMCHEMECIDEMELMFGIMTTMTFCKLCAWKYRYRAGNKGSAEEDQKKADWYIRKYQELKEKLEEER
jgi:hypothetical protein